MPLANPDIVSESSAILAPTASHLILPPIPARVRRAFRRLGLPFRGEIWENAAQFKFLGKAYESMPAAQGGHFRIETARHLAGPLRAWKHPAVRYIFVRKAVQTFGSMLIDLILPYIIEFEPRNTLVLFESDEKALNYASVRLMDTLRQHPVIGPLIVGVQQENRHLALSTFIKFRDMTLMIGGLKDGNVSSLSWPNVLISEAWMHKSDGLLFKAFGRTTQFEANCKVLVESQAGEAGEDFDSGCKSAVEIPLTWACPYCGGRQTFEFTQERPSDFVARPQLSFDEGRLPMQAPPPPLTYAGMTFGGLTRMVAGKEETLTMEERAATSVWECYHCGAHIADTPSNRRGLMDSYEQVLPDPVPKRVLFTWPEEASLNVSLAESTTHYLTAKHAYDQGNAIQLEDWYKSRRGVAWSDRLVQKRVKVITGTYDAANGIPNEMARLMMVDCQQSDDLSAQQDTSVIGHFWYIAWAIDKFGNIFQLARGYAKNWAEWLAVQKRLKIPNKNTGVDGGNWLHEVLDFAAAHWELTQEKHGRRTVNMRSTWKILRGNGVRKSFRWKDGVWRVTAMPSYYQRRVEIKKGEVVMLQIPVYEWSNLAVKDQLFTLRQGGPGKPKMVKLPRENLDAQTQAMEKGVCTYEMQTQSEHRTRENGRDIWLGPPNVHYNDCECEGLVLAGLGGLIGHTAAPDEAGAEA